MQGTVTYREPSIAETIKQRFVPLQVDTTAEASKPLVERFRQVWTPDVRVLGSDGFEYYRWNGYLPPSEFLPQLLVAQAQACLRMNDPGGAAEIYEDVLRRFPTSAFAPEAEYYLAVCKYRRSHEADDLLGGWRQVQTRYPDSIWRVKQSFIEQR